MNWSAAPPINYGGETWGQKNSQFRQIFQLPSLAPDIDFVVALGHTTSEQFPEQAAIETGWKVVDPWQTVPDWKSYRRFIEQSRAEISVAKETYVKARTGWFSERSACYLASGRPVITQNTGWADHPIHGKGVVFFDDLPSCVGAIREVERDYSIHAKAARRLAAEYSHSSSYSPRAYLCWVGMAMVGTD